jgi:predicted CopG family antitoxin
MTAKGTTVYLTDEQREWLRERKRKERSISSLLREYIEEIMEREFELMDMDAEATADAAECIRDGQREAEKEAR